MQVLYLVSVSDLCRAFSCLGLVEATEFLHIGDLFVSIFENSLCIVTFYRVLVAGNSSCQHTSVVSAFSCFIWMSYAKFLTIPQPVGKERIF